MSDLNDAWRAQRQRRWTRESAHLYIRPDAQRFMLPGAKFSIKASLNPHWHRPRAQPSAPGESKYSPNQQRVPAGDPNGGRWTSGDVANPFRPPRSDANNKDHEDSANRVSQNSWKSAIISRWPDGSPKTQTAVDELGTIIHAELSQPGGGGGWDERYTVSTKEGPVTFENAGGVQTVRDHKGNVVAKTEWTESGPEAAATLQTVQFAQGAVAAGRAAIAGAAALHSWWSSQNGQGTQAILSFNATGFAPGAAITDNAVRVDQLSRDDVAQACPRYSEVKSIADEAAQVIDRGAYASAATYGTAVHKWIADQVNGPSTVPRSEPRDPDFRAEFSVLKSKAENYGVSGTKRIDVFENPRNGNVCIYDGNVCIYDIKTGNSQLSAGRMLELASQVSFLYPGTQRIVVTEVKPGQ